MDYLHEIHYIHNVPQTQDPLTFGQYSTNHRTCFRRSRDQSHQPIISMKYNTNNDEKIQDALIIIALTVYLRLSTREMFMRLEGAIW